MKSEWGKTISKFFLIPQRVLTAIMGFLGITIAYTLRSSLSLTITKMVSNVHEIGETECIVEDEDPDSPLEPGEFDWSEETQGLILSSFFFGYILVHIPAGLLAARYGGKITLLTGLLISTLITLITPVCVRKGGAIVLIFLRILVGAGQGVVFPASNVLLANWAPVSERSILSTIVYSGSLIGQIVGTFFSSIVLSYYTWPAVFYCFGILAIVWCIFFYLLCYNSPESHPFIKESEREYLKRELSQVKQKKEIPPTPWRKILTSPPVIALVIAQIGHNWGFFIMTSDLPKYMNDVLHFSVQANGLYSSLPYVVMFLVGIITGFVSDYIVKKKYLSIGNVRKLWTIVSTIGPGAFMIGASYAECEKMMVVAMFTIGMGFMGTFYSGHKANNLDLAPNYAGVLMALSNGIGAISGMIGPYIVGVIATDRLISQWQIVFWITFAVFAVTTLVFVIWSSGDVQHWNDIVPPKSEMESGVKNPEKNESNEGYYDAKIKS